MDSSIYIFRAWFVLPDTLVDSQGQPANALYGFADFLLGLLENEQPEYIACAFDASLSSSYRNDIYPAYKANRDPAPEELKQQFQHCRALARAAGIAEFASERYEADDIIGTLCSHMRKHDFYNLIISGDKDLTQLVDEHDFWWEYSKDVRMDRKGVYKQFGVYPEQIADLLALAGDAVDNIPGVPGIGLKTAARLLNKFGTLDAALSNIETIGAMKFRGAKRVQNLLQEHQELARLSRELTLIQHDDQLPSHHSALKRQPYDADALNTLFDQFGFGTHRRQRWLASLNP
ncbi:MAG: flap endonuclease [Gammaproteobacteria bacterium]|nr:flap endonuclease [Gammaproteobacteria bacterium]